jgi:twitching motility protein PilT
MSLVPSLLQAIVRVDGEALVMHAGDKPYVVSPTGQVELANRGLTLEAVNGIVAQLLPAELQAALEEFGAVQYELPAFPEFPGEHFTVVAARGGDDVWTEIRRRRVPDDDRVPEEFFGPSATPPSPPPPVVAAAPPPPVVMPQPVVAQPAVETPPIAKPVVEEPVIAKPVVEQPVIAKPVVEQPIIAPPPVVAKPVTAQPAMSTAPVNAPVAAPRSVPPPPSAPPVDHDDEVPQSIGFRHVPEPVDVPQEGFDDDDDLMLPDATHLWPERPSEAQPRASHRDEQAIDLDMDYDADVDQEEEEAAAPPMATAPPPVVAPEMPVIAAETPVAPVVSVAAPRAVPPQQPAVVLQISRNPIRSEQPPPLVSDPTLSGLERLLRLSAARGASTLYLSSGSRPSVRVDGELQMLDGEPVHVSRDVESLLLTLMPERSHEALRTGAATEWICEIEGVGRVRCMSFRDHLGPGGVFRLMPTRSVSADQLGLPRPVQSLAIEPEGLVLVAGPRSSGKRTLMAAFVDLMNRTRRDHIITIEREINIVHERGHSFISQREVRGDDEDMLAAARGALREDPDVLVIEDLRTGPLMNVALEAAASGRLVVGGFSAHTATGAIDRIIDLYAPEYRRQVQFALADSLRGVIVQALLRKIGGGRLPAREVLLNTPAVSSVIAEGKTSQLPMAIEGGRRYGMMPLNDALVGLVQSGAVEPREAYRMSPDRPGYLAALNRNGIDTSFVERLA